jgi:hypothetical protein
MLMIEVQYMVVIEAIKEALWLKGLVKELGVEQGGVQFQYDSQSAIHLAKHQMYHVRDGRTLESMVEQTPQNNNGKLEINIQYLRGSAICLHPRD